MESRFACRFTDAPTAVEAVFGYLLDNAGRSMTEREVRAALGLGRSTTSVALAELARSEAVTVERVGRTGRYRTDPGDPLVRHLKIARAIGRARRVLAPVRSLVESATLFGSASRGEDSTGSDIDVLIVAKQSEKVLAALASHRWLQAVVMSPEEYLSELAADSAFARETSGGIRVLEPAAE